MASVLADAVLALLPLADLYHSGIVWLIFLEAARLIDADEKSFNKINNALGYNSVRFRE